MVRQPRFLLGSSVAPSGERPATVVDVAREAGVSATTVSNHLHHPDRVTRATALRIEAALADLGYEANEAARLLCDRRATRDADGAGRSSAPPTIRDVARLAGVSYQTVSRALNRPDRVRPSTAERVAAAVHELGFVADPAARALQRQAARGSKDCPGVP